MRAALPSPTFSDQTTSLKLLYRLLLNKESNLDLQLETALGLVSSFLGLDLGLVSHIQGDAYIVKGVYAPGTDMEPGTSFDVGDTYCNLVLAADDVISIDDVKTSRYEGHPCYHSFGLESYIGAPVVVSGKRFGTINFSSAQPRQQPFSEADREFVRLLAEWAGMILERDGADQALRRSEEKMRLLAHRDELTALPNRRAFFSTAQQQQNLAKRKNWSLALLYLDINGFKEVNDSLGHDAGDKLLQGVAERLRSVTRFEEPFARMGGDEFALLLLDTSQAGASKVAERIAASLEEPFIYSDTTVNIGASIGIAEGEASLALDVLLHRADQAMYEAKQGKQPGQSAVAVWNKEDEENGVV